MTIKLYELCGANPDQRYSPYAWRTRFALCHKKLPFEGIAWRYTEKDMIKASGQGKIPVIEDQGKWIYDSWTIANYLDETYPKQPRLIPEGAKGAMHGFNQMVDNHLQGLFRPLAMLPILNGLRPEDVAVFRETREKMLGMSLEAYGDPSQYDKKIQALQTGLAIFHPVIKDQSFFGGKTPNYADYILMGSFMWIKSISKIAFLKQDDPLFAWSERMLDLYDGEGRKACL